ncbi:MAG: hypothetical protein P8N25_00625 [Alphaproteobacteria bacterium]|nr:hypothetical protein [Alphaproteobacteria bacterium]
MSIFHNKKSLKKRYIQALSYSVWRIWLFKVLLLCVLVALVATILIPVIFSDITNVSVKVKEAVNNSKNNEVYLTNMKYDDAGGDISVEASRAYANKTDEQNLENAKITKNSSNEVLTAKKMKVETKKDKYTAKGNVKYVGKDIIINSDEAVYNKKNGDLKAQGNLKIVIKNKK